MERSIKKVVCFAASVAMMVSTVNMPDAGGYTYAAEFTDDGAAVDNTEELPVDNAAGQTAGFVTTEDGKLQFRTAEGDIVADKVFKVGRNRYKSTAEGNVICEDFWVTDLGNSVYTNKKGRIVKNRVFTASDGNKYYAYKSGKIVKGRIVVYKGVEYSADENGVLTEIG